MHRTIIALLSIAIPLAAQQPAAEVKADTSADPIAVVVKADGAGVMRNVKEATFNFQEGTTDVLITSRQSGKLRIQSASGNPSPIIIEITSGSVKRVCVPCGESQTCHEY